MEKDRLAWLRQPLEGPASGVVRSTHFDRRVDAFDAALRAQLMHVAIGFNKDRSRPVELLIDLCVYISMTEPKPSSYLDAARAMVLIESKRRSRSPRSYNKHHIEPKADYTIIPNSFCTSFPSDYYTCTTSVVGEPMTLQIIFDASSEQKAQTEAMELCNRFSRWDTAETTLITAVKKIQDAIVKLTVTGATSPDLLYKTAVIKTGWKPRVKDDADFLWCVAARERVAHKLPAIVREFCHYRLEEAWNDTAKDTGLSVPENIANQIGDSVDDDMDNDFVDAERLMAAVFGNRPVRRLR